MTDDDMGDTLAPNSTQLDAVDLLGGPQTFTVKRVTKASGEQPLSVYFEEFDRPWRPGVNQRRVLGNVWGTKFGVWVGRRLTVHCDQSVDYGGKKVGGIRVTHMSHITKRTGTPIIPTRGKADIYNVDPLREEARPSPDDLALAVVENIAEATTEAEVREWGNRAHAQGLLDVQVKAQTVRDHVTYRLAELEQGGQS